MIYGIPHLWSVNSYGRNRALFASKNLERVAHHGLLCPGEKPVEARKKLGVGRSISYLCVALVGPHHNHRRDGRVPEPPRENRCVGPSRRSRALPGCGELPRRTQWRADVRSPGPYFPRSDYSTASTCKVDCRALGRCDGRVPLPATQARRRALFPKSSQTWQLQERVTHPP